MDGEQPLCPCTFFVPVTYDGGEDVELEKFNACMIALRRQFEAMTFLPQVQGEWQGIQESHAWILIALPDSRVEELKKVVRWIGKELKQETMYFQAGAVAFILKCDDEALSSRRDALCQSKKSPTKS